MRFSLRRGCIIFTVILLLLLMSGCDKVKQVSSDLGDKVQDISENVSSGINDFISDPTGKENNEFVFEEPEVEDKTSLVEPASEVDIIRLYLGDNIYYPVEIPADTEILTDNSKYVYAVDNSFSISVASNVPWDEFSNYVSIKDSESVQPDLIKSVDGKKGVQEAAKHVANDKAVIVRVYDNPIAFATILNGLENNTYRVTSYTGMIREEDITEDLSALPKYTGYHVTITAGLGDDIQKIYNFDDGVLTISKEYKKFKDAVSLTSIKLAVINQDNVADKVFVSDELIYIEKDDYTIAIQAVNYNTAITLFGTGKEARYNIIAFISS